MDDEEKYELRRDVKFGSKLMMGQATRWVVWAIVISLVLGFVGVKWYQWEIGQNRVIVQHSLSYYATQTTAMENFITDFNSQTILIAQAKAQYGDSAGSVITAYQQAQVNDVQQVWFNFDKLPNDVHTQLPSDIQKFLQEHPRNWQPQP